MHSDVDVIVVGAGLSGLQAAVDLDRLGHDVVVLEARERPGGRVFTVESPAGTPVDLGAAWFVPGEARVSELVRTLGLTTVDDAAAPRRKAGLRARLSSLRGPGPRERLREAAVRSGAWTFDEWLRRNVRGTAVRDSLVHEVRLAWGAEPEEIALQDAARQVAAGTRLRLAAGAQALADGLLVALPADTVRFDAAVDAVVQHAGRVRVRSEGGAFTARAAIVAVPPAVAWRIAFEPALPPGRRRLAARLGAGAAVGAAVFFDEPPGFLCTPPAGVELLDVSGADGALALALRGRRALDVSDLAPDDRRAALQEIVTECVGPRAPRVVEIVDVDWSSEPFSGGGPAGFLTPGLDADARERLRTPHGRVFWAGAELDDDAPQRMEGALASGARAAATVAAVLGTP